MYKVLDIQSALKNFSAVFPRHCVLGSVQKAAQSFDHDSVLVALWTAASMSGVAEWKQLSETILNQPASLAALFFMLIKIRTNDGWLASKHFRT